MLPILQVSVDQDEVIEALVNIGLTVLLFIVAFVLLYVVGKAVLTRIVRRSLKERGYEKALIGMAVSVTTIIMFVLAIALAATVAGFGVVLSAFAILGGALALAIGFAAQDLISNFVAGVFIIQDEPFVIDDWIEWDGHSGIVKEIQPRVTKVQTFDEELVTVPNSHLANAAVVNPVASDRLRVSYEFGIGYDENIDHAREVITEEGAQVAGVFDEPKPAAPVVDLGDSAVVLSGRIWVNPNETGAAGARAAFVERVKKRFDAEDIEMPYHNTELSGEVTVHDAA